MTAVCVRPPTITLLIHTLSMQTSPLFAIFCVNLGFTSISAIFELVSFCTKIVESRKPLPFWLRADQKAKNRKQRRVGVTRLGLIAIPMILLCVAVALAAPKSEDQGSQPLNVIRLLNALVSMFYVLLLVLFSILCAMYH